jgi:predicted nucleotidyltransferase
MGVLIMDACKIAQAVSAVGGVKAVVLGGSQSRGEAAADSDYDLGVYYRAGELDTSALARVLWELDDSHGDALLHLPGEWGRWINGGAWLSVEGVSVDILLRETGRVEAVLWDCLSGNITIDYQCGHPFGFVNTIYAAEVHFCKPLWQDGSEPVSALKAMLVQEGGYPAVMREAVIRKFLWEAWFSLSCGRKPALAGEINYAMGSAFRSVTAWSEVLYALNGKYLMNEKQALTQASRMERAPADLEKRVQSAYALLAAGEAAQAWAILDGLHAEIQLLTQDVQLVTTRIR